MVRSRSILMRAMRRLVSHVGRSFSFALFGPGMDARQVGVCQPYASAPDLRPQVALHHRPGPDVKAIEVLECLAVTTPPGRLEHQPRAAIERHGCAGRGRRES